MKRLAWLSLLALALVASKGPFFEPLSESDRRLHALQRLTFGARESDLQQITKLGVDKWITQQLQPEKITENSVLTSRLAGLETLKLSTTETLKRFPPPQLLLAATRTKAFADLGESAEEKAIINAKIKALAARTNQGNAAILNANADRRAEGAIELLGDTLSADQLQMLRKGTAQEKRDLLLSLPPEKLALVAAMIPQATRREVLAISDEASRRRLIYAAQPSALVTTDLQEAKLLRAVYSERQLQELLVDFWFNHFNVNLEKGFTRAFVTSYERDAIRPHVLGKFRDMLGATAKHPAMLFYLDNAQSVDPNASKQMSQRMGRRMSNNRNRNNGEMQSRIAQRMQNRGLNENYARELMELHTLGVDGGYSQTDVKEVARAFTGWGIRAIRADGGEIGSFVFQERLHDKTEKTVLGKKLKAGRGMEDGEDVLDLLARHPSTAKYVSFRLAQKFVADEPPSSLVDRMAQTFLRSDGNLKAVMEAMLKSEEFWSQGAYRTKIKSPLQMVVSAVRATGAEVKEPMVLAQKIEEMGQPLYRKLEPTGYKNIGQEWVSSNALVSRMNFAMDLSLGKLAGVRASFAERDLTSAAQRLLLMPLSTATLEAMNKKSEAKQSNPAMMAGLVMGSPEFQRH
jgi:uncharacterized protein (DUF1800 family)